MFAVRFVLPDEMAEFVIWEFVICHMQCFILIPLINCLPHMLIKALQIKQQIKICHKHGQMEIQLSD